MNYEEKYNEALERAKKFEEKYGGDYAGYIFPELAESDDERIRKEIYNFFKNFKETGTWKSISDVNTWLDYLEKQQESLHIPETSKENANSFTDGIIEVRSFQRGVEEGRRLEKQKEQKPAEWSEEDEKYLNRVINLWVNDWRG